MPLLQWIDSMLQKIIHEELNQARIAEKKAALELNVESREKVFDSLKGNKYTILKAEDKLTDKQKIKLDTIREASPLIAKSAGGSFPRRALQQ